MKLLYNGILLPDSWPPQNISEDSREDLPVPYLKNPPKVININVGRQLFVDDFLIEESSLQTEYHEAKKYQGNPVFFPQTQLEMSPLACATPKSGGVWWDNREECFKMWYEAGWLHANAYATSKDGIHWDRPVLNIRGDSNQILPEIRPDSTTVIIDEDCKDESQRYKMLIRNPDGGGDTGYVLVSADGLHWSEPVKTGGMGDRSTFFFNPFTKKYVFSVRSATFPPPNQTFHRTRKYRECSDFLAGATWNNSSQKEGRGDKGITQAAETGEVKELVLWQRTDEKDIPRFEGFQPQLYNVDAVAYESIMLGMFEIHYGPENDYYIHRGIPKSTALIPCYSRDGFHFSRPNRKPLIEGTGTAGSWDRGYVQSVGGICTVMGDELWIYYTGFSGDESNTSVPWYTNGMYSGGSTGIAKLRRDGFVSVNGNELGGSLITRKVCFEGSYLFLNAQLPQGELAVSVLDENNCAIAPFTAKNSRINSIDSTRYQISWQGSSDLSRLAGRPVKFRFELRDAKLYSFWVSKDLSGTSGGYLAGGGPGYKSYRDE